MSDTPANGLEPFAQTLKGLCLHQDYDSTCSLTESRGVCEGDGHTLTSTCESLGEHSRSKREQLTSITLRPSARSAVAWECHAISDSVDLATSPSPSSLSPRPHCASPEPAAPFAALAAVLVAAQNTDKLGFRKRPAYCEAQPDMAGSHVIGCEGAFMVYLHLGGREEGDEGWSSWPASPFSSVQAPSPFKSFPRSD